MKPQSALILAPLAALAFALSLPPSANAAQPASASHAKMVSAPMYACSICHHQVTAAEAKKLHYTCPVDHGKLLPVKPAAKLH